MNQNFVRLERILLKNFLPLLATTGLDTIEIDWRNALNNLTLILGANGSGKTFLLTEMTPHPYEAVANRSKNSTKIIPGKNGRKEIDLCLNDKYRYLCKIDYQDNGPTKCFLEKIDLANGVKIDLNPNGNVASYLDALEIELGFTSSYINIGYISDGVMNLVKMSPQERNVYIAQWLPYIVEFLEGHKNVQKNRNLVKRQIDQINNDIAKIVVGDYVQELNNVNSSISSLEVDLELTQTNLTKCEVFMSTLREIDSRQLRNNLIDRRSTNDRITSERTDVDRFVADADRYSGDEGRKRLEAEINSILQRRKGFEVQLQENDRRITEMRFQIQEQEARSRSLQTEEQISLVDILDALKTFITEEKALVQTRVNYVETFPFFENVEIDNVGLNTILSSFEEVKRIWVRIQNLVDAELLKNGGLQGKAENIEKRIIFTKLEKDSMEKETRDLANRIYILNNNGLDPNILSLKRTECTPEHCPLVRELMTYLQPSKEILKVEATLQEKMNQLRKTEETLANESDDLVSIRQAFGMLEDINHILYRNRELISKLPEELMHRINVDPTVFISEIHNIENQLKGLEEYISVDEKIKLIQSKINSLQKTETILRIQDQYSKDSESKIVEYESETRRRAEILKELESMDSNLGRLRFVQGNAEVFTNRIQLLNAQIHTHNNLCQEFRIDATHWYYRSHLRDIIYNLREKRQSIKTTIENLRIAKETIQSRIATKQMLEKKREDLTQAFKTYELLEKIWSPRSGYPALLIKDFMDDVKRRTNEDLQSMWGDSLLIKDFVLTESEFSIQVIRAGGYPVPDAALCSDGEKATLAVAISIAILEIHVERHPYNVVRLDEIDAKLDDARRRSYLNIILERMDEIGCKSCFVITHNNEFNNVDANMILMPGIELDPAFLQNKNILFSA